MIRKYIFLLVFLAVNAFTSAVATEGWITDRSVSADIYSKITEAENLLGASPEELFSRLGVPESVDSLRGDEPWQDDVVFRYSGGISVYWFRNRVWQLGFDGGRYGRLTRDEVESELGIPWRTGADFYVYLLPDAGYPVRMKIVFHEGESAVFIYRGDL